jgi:hypothetical protein
MNTVLRVGIWLALPMFFVGSLLAQNGACTISGTVYAEDERALAGTRIERTQHGLSLSQFADANGRFHLPCAVAGSLRLRFEHPSTGEVGTYEALTSNEMPLHLVVVLRTQPPLSSHSHSWEIREQPAESAGPWPAERVLTDRLMESMPNTEHLWGLLNHLDASLVADRYDISGMHSQRQFLFGVRGSSWTQNQAILNGLTVSHPSGEGMLQFPDLTAFKSIAYSVGDSPSQHAGAGGHLSLAPKSGSREFHGQARLFFQGGVLQDSNVTSRHRSFGITESDERWQHYLNGGVQMGGPLGNLPWTWFGAFSSRDLKKWIRDHPLAVSAGVNQGTLHLLGNWDSGNQVALFWSAQRVREPQSGASPQITREASLDLRQHLHTLQGSWTRFLSPASTLDLRVGVSLSRLDARNQPGGLKQSREELFPGFTLLGVGNPLDPLEMVRMLSNVRTGTAPIAMPSNTAVWEGSVLYSTLRVGPAHSSHRISLGAGSRSASLDQRYQSADGVNLLYFESAPDSVRLLNTPAQTRDRLRQLDFHAADSVSFGRLNWTVAVHSYHWAGNNLLNSGRSMNRLGWNNLSARLGTAYRLALRHPLVVRMGIARIYSQPLAGTWTALNPEGLGVRLSSWNDANVDGQYQPGEDTRILKRYGSPFTRLDPELKNPHTDELTLGFTQSIGGVTFQATGYRRSERHLISLVNEGVPPSSYFPVQVLDPGPDGYLGAGGDDQFITVFNQKPETLGQDRYLLTNPPGHNGHSEGFTLKLGYSTRRLMAEASATRYRAVAATAPGMTAWENDTGTLLGVFDDPNKSILARGSTYFDRGTLGRIWMSWDLGRHLIWSVIAGYQDGLPCSRYLPVKGLNQGVIGVLTLQRGPGEAGSIPGFMTTHYRNIDIRLTKEVSLVTGSLQAMVDVFNLTNAAQTLLQTDVTAPTQLWRIPLRFQTPRSLQLGLRYKW